MGWQWDKTRRTDPTRISRHWLVLSVATLLALAYGTRVEDAYDRNIDPGNLRTPPKTPVPVHRNPWRRTGRTVSVIRHGMERLRRLLIQRRLWTQLWLLPEPWPEPKSNLEITRHAPTQKTRYIPLSAEDPPEEAQAELLWNGDVLVGWPDYEDVPEVHVRARLSSGSADSTKWCYNQTGNWCILTGMGPGTWIIQVMKTDFTTVLSRWVVLEIP